MSLMAFSKRNKWTLTGVGGALLMVSGIALAAQLTVTGGTVPNVGDATFASACDTTVTATPGSPVWATNQWEIEEVLVTNIAAACDTKTIKAIFTGQGGTGIGNPGNATMDATGSVTIPMDPAPADSVVGVSVALDS